ncbi:MAG: hypothetical protein Q8R28_14580 [Dehalococcoidia bacterium]|nr:hypothetical protein [Dehalococcoidia bacterium]
MSTERRVVALVSPKMLTNSKTGMHAARILELGLTAYSGTPDEALQKVKRMYASAVRAHRELGTLEDWLSLSGLEWYWEDDYEGVTPVVDADDRVQAGRLRGQKKAAVASHNAGDWHDYCSALPMAA